MAGTIEESEEDLRLAGDRNNLETDVDFANAFQQMGIGRRSHFVEERAITLQDVDPVGNPMEELQQQMVEYTLAMKENITSTLALVRR